ncbi:hypothetical protein D3C76_1674230 [compost metagenome]
MKLVRGRPFLKSSAAENARIKIDKNIEIRMVFFRAASDEYRCIPSAIRKKYINPVIICSVTNILPGKPYSMAT